MLRSHDRRRSHRISARDSAAAGLSPARGGAAPLKPYCDRSCCLSSSLFFPLFSPYDRKLPSPVLSQHFVIQKASFQGDFKDVDILNARPLSGYQEYSYIDKKPKKNENSYRIKTVLKDGTFQYSQTKTINFNNRDVVQVYSSPNAEVVNLELSSYVNQNVKVFLYDLLGQPVYSQLIQQVTDKPVKIDILDLPEGQYQLSIIPQNKSEITKMLFIRN